MGYINFLSVSLMLLLIYQKLLSLSAHCLQDDMEQKNDEISNYAP